MQHALAPLYRGASEIPMNASIALTHQATSLKRLSWITFVMLLAVFAGGCMTQEAESDQNWRRYNPEWRSPTPPDPRPQWQL